MHQGLPMFPLNAVVFPGAVFPLHVFEDRYRELMRDLIEIEDPIERVFGVLAIREGYEVGDHGSQSLHRVGVLCQLTHWKRNPDGTLEVEATARQRLRVETTDATGSYLKADVELLDDPELPDGPEEAARTLDAFERYRLELGMTRDAEVLAGPLPEDPTYLSYALSAACLLTLPQRQALLEAFAAPERLSTLRHLIHEELRAMRAIPSLPATEVARTLWSPN